jgi:hypothetical protein
MLPDAVKIPRDPVTDEGVRITGDGEITVFSNRHMKTVIVMIGAIRVTLGHEAAARVGYLISRAADDIT